jgi:[acyl-carrier-protein] S-malonyltransferase
LSVRVAFVFPGQGSYRPGALAAWDRHPAAHVLDVVAERTGCDLRALDRDPSTGERTADAQPAIFAASLLAWQALTDAGVRPDVVAGHSLGEASAAVAAGALTPGDGATLVAERGRAMAAACEAAPGGMAALVKLSQDAVEVLVAEDPDLVVANDNADGQVVVAGTTEAIGRIRDRARDAGGRALPLRVEGAFHSPAMAPAVERIAATLELLPVGSPTVPLVSGTGAQPLRTGTEIEQALVAGILAPVRWREVQQRLQELGVEHLVEVGPGGVLAGLARRATADVCVHTVAAPTDVEQVADAVSLVGVG